MKLMFTLTRLRRFIYLIALALFILSCSAAKKPIEPCRILSGHKHKVNSLAYSQDGRYLISAGWDNTVIKWDLENSDTKQVLRGHTDNIWDCTISSDGRFIGSASLDNSFIICRCHNDPRKLWRQSVRTELFCLNVAFVSRRSSLTYYGIVERIEDVLIMGKYPAYIFKVNNRIINSCRIVKSDSYPFPVNRENEL